MHLYNLIHVIMFLFKLMWNRVYTQWVNKLIMEEQMLHGKQAGIVDGKFLG